MSLYYDPEAIARSIHDEELTMSRNATPLVWTKHRNANGSIDYTTPLSRPVNAYDGTAEIVLIWYNNTTRDWVVSLASDTVNRYQRGNSEYVYSRQDAELAAASLVNGSDR